MEDKYQTKKICKIIKAIPILENWHIYDMRGGE